LVARLNTISERLLLFCSRLIKRSRFFDSALWLFRDRPGDTQFRSSPAAWLPALEVSNVKLLAKFNLVLVLVFGLGMLLISHFAYNFLMDNARQQVLGQAELMAASATATKDYTDAQVSPILERTPQHNRDFLPQTIPFSAANVTFKYLRSSYPDYVLREAALNPTDLEDRATEWEADLINYFRDHPSQHQHVGERATPIGEVLYVATPIVAAKGCLPCHSEPSIAPRAMIRHYGPDHGFGWNLNQTIGAQIVSVPMSIPVALAGRGFRNLVITLGAIFLLAIILIDLAVYMIVIRPLRRVSKNADVISKGEIDLPPLEIRGKDEIAEVTASFNRMHTSLIKAFEMLNG
jgi:HAMP domain-containing protein